MLIAYKHQWLAARDICEIKLNHKRVDLRVCLATGSLSVAWRMWAWITFPMVCGTST